MSKIEPAQLDPQEFKKIAEGIYGKHGWRTALATELGLTRQTLSNWALGLTPLPKWLGFYMTQRWRIHKQEQTYANSSYDII